MWLLCEPLEVLDYLQLPAAAKVCLFLDSMQCNSKMSLTEHAWYLGITAHLKLWEKIAAVSQSLTQHRKGVCQGMSV